MSLPNLIEAYEDVRVVLDAVLRQGGGTFVLPTRTEAELWRRRAYKFRKLANAEGERKYNGLILRLRNETSIVFDENRVVGTLLDPDGLPVDLTTVLSEDPIDTTGDIIE